MGRAFTVSVDNPNPSGGCLCSGELANEDSSGPFIIFPATETDAPAHLAPHAVLCAGCVAHCGAAVDAHDRDEAGADEPPRI